MICSLCCHRGANDLLYIFPGELMILLPWGGANDLLYTVARGGANEGCCCIFYHL